MAKKRLLSQRQVTEAIRHLLEVGGTFDAMTLEGGGTCLMGEELPQMRDDNVLLLEFDNDQVFEVVVRERKET